MAFTRCAFVLPLVLMSLVGYSLEQLTAYPHYTYCPSYCNTQGDWQSGPTCPEYCCGNATYRYCCGDYFLDVTNKYSDVSSCSCPNTDCYSTPVWEYFLYFFAPLAFFLIIAVCCCQCWHQTICKKCCKKTTANATTDNRIAAASSLDSITTFPDSVARNANLHFDPDFNYDMQPPSYETVTRDLPKYEDLVNEASGYNGPFESAEDLYAPPGEYEVVTAPPSECLNNDALPPSYTPATHEEA